MKITCSLICAAFAMALFFPIERMREQSNDTVPPDAFVPMVPFAATPPDVDEFPEGEAGGSEQELPPSLSEIEGEWALTDDKNARKAAMASLPWKILNLHRVGQGALPALVVKTLDPGLEYAMLIEADKIVITVDDGRPGTVNVCILYDKSKVYAGSMVLVGVNRDPKATKTAVRKDEGASKPALPAKPAAPKEKPKARDKGARGRGPAMVA